MALDKVEIQIGAKSTVAPGVNEAVQQLQRLGGVGAGAGGAGGAGGAISVDSFLKLGAGVNALRSAFTLATGAIGFFRGELGTLQEQLERLPLGIGAVIASIRGFSEEVYGVAALKAADAKAEAAVKEKNALRERVALIAQEAEQLAEVNDYARERAAIEEKARAALKETRSLGQSAFDAVEGRRLAALAAVDRREQADRDRRSAEIAAKIAAEQAKGEAAQRRIADSLRDADQALALARAAETGQADGQLVALRNRQQDRLLRAQSIIEITTLRDAFAVERENLLAELQRAGLASALGGLGDSGVNLPQSLNITSRFQGRAENFRGAQAADLSRDIIAAIAKVQAEIERLRQDATNSRLTEPELNGIGLD